MTRKAKAHGSLERIVKAHAPIEGIWVREKHGDYRFDSAHRMKLPEALLRILEKRQDKTVYTDIVLRCAYDLHASNSNRTKIPYMIVTDDAKTIGANPLAFRQCHLDSGGRIYRSQRLEPVFRSADLPLTSRLVFVGYDNVIGIYNAKHRESLAKLLANFEYPKPKGKILI